MRQARRRQTKKRKWPKVLGITVGILAVLAILGVVFFTPLNNTYRNVTGNDTPADTAIKNEMVKKIEARKTGDATSDALLDKAASAIADTKMSTLMAAAKDQSQMASLLSSATGMSSSTAEVSAAALFAMPSLTPLREAVAKGDYVKAYQAYKDLDTSTLSQLRNTMAQ